MRIGLTYDLRAEYLERGYSEEQVAEFDSPRTIEGIEQALASLGHDPVRIGSLPSLVASLSQGERWDLVFNIAEGLGRYGREALVPALLEYYGLPYTFSDPMTLSLTLHKGMAKRVVRDLGLATPDFAVVAEPSQAASVNLGWPLFAKPVAEGTGRGVEAASKVTGREQLAAVCAELIARYGQPVLVESFLPGREFTVGIVGTGPKARIIGVMEVLLRSGADAEVYSYRNKEECESLVSYRRVKGAIAGEAGELALASWRGLECRDAGRVDLRCDAAGKPSFLEVNPLAGLHPEHSDLPILCGLVEMPYVKLIERIVASALERRLMASPCPAPGLY
ncbi:MAG: D-alanine--D-alanine ligase [Desulfarculaceae bacterium]|nr:D-alanine--D-alanine ligase [Desulfarculaceae bacterium]